MTKDVAHSGFASIEGGEAEHPVIEFYDRDDRPTFISNVEFVGDLHIGHVGGALVFRRDGRVETTGNLKPDALAAVVIGIIKQQWPAAIGQAPSGDEPKGRMQKGS